MARMVALGVLLLLCLCGLALALVIMGEGTVG
jgi:hypothetical protein